MNFEAQNDSALLETSDFQKDLQEDPQKKQLLLPNQSSYDQKHPLTKPSQQLGTFSHPEMQ